MYIFYITPLSGDYAEYNNRIHRNPAFQDIIKKNANDVQSIWFLCLLYISYIADLSWDYLKFISGITGYYPDKDSYEWLPI